MNEYMADDAEQLAQAEDVPVYRAEKALSLEDGDYDEAQTRLREASVAIKCRFASQNNDIYGLFLIILNITPPSLESMIVLVGNHRGIGNVKLSLSHSEFSDSIERLIQEKGKMSALSEQLEGGLQQAFSPPSSELVEIIKGRNELDLQDALDQLIRDSIDEEELLTTVSLETGLVEGAVEGSGGDEETTEQTSPGETDQVELLCDVRVSPVRGHPVANLEPGDKIFVSIKDGQDEHGKLMDVIQQLEDDETGMIPVPISEVSRTNTGKLEFIVQFGENVFGKVVAGEDMNILTPDSVSSTSPGGLFDSVLTWVFLFMIIMVIGLSILYGILI